MSRTYQNIFNNTPGHGEIIGAVAVYPADDSKHIKEVPATSRDLTDRFIARHPGTTFSNALIRALARRLTSISNGITAQNLNMLNLLERNLQGDPLTNEKKALFAEYGIGEEGLCLG